jgi:hypothetical protein
MDEVFLIHPHHPAYGPHHAYGHRPDGLTGQRTINPGVHQSGAPRADQGSRTRGSRCDARLDTPHHLSI